MLHVVAVVLGVIALALGACWGVSRWLSDPPAVSHALALSAVITGGVAGPIFVRTRGTVRLTRRDGFAIVTFSWIGVSLCGALPYFFSGVCPNPVDAVFETMSGFTTTGASVLSDLEAVPRGIMFWRCLSQWLGGMGVLVLCVAILPFLGVGGMQIYRAEMPGPTMDRLTPRIANTAKLLWGVYLAMTLIEALLLKLGPMDLFEALCHSFTTMSTGGFSTRSASVAAFDSLYTEVVIDVFMLLAGINFVLHFKALTGRPGIYWRDPECRFYLQLWLFCVLFVTLTTWRAGNMEGLGHAFRAAVFQVTSIMTTTGYCTEDFNVWHPAAKFILVGLMFTGACAGSTAGGMKLLRVYAVWQKVVRDIRRFVRPQAVFQVKIGRQTVPPDIVAHITGFVLIFIGVFAVATVLMSFWTHDLVTAFSSVVATLGNIGPGLGGVGAVENFGWIGDGGKMVLIVCMLLGRLELYTVLAFFLPSFWRR